MTENLSDEFGRATARHATLYREWALGGAGLLITGNVQVDRRFLERPGNVCIDGEQDQEQLDRLTAFAAGGTAKGGHIWMQIGHAGRQSNGKVNYWPVGPSDVRLHLPKMAFGTPRALEKPEIEKVSSWWTLGVTLYEA
jgi:2,4-dienoyl-CoA reductase-like NADH-dependent reductase (Old Yellow Enzyme family)